jgi:chromosome segregation ATPase
MPWWAQLLVASLGSGGVAALGTAFLKSRVAVRRIAAQGEDATRAAALSLVKEARGLAREEREATGKHREAHLECLEQVGQVRVELASLSERYDLTERELAAIRREHAECPWKIEALEGQVNALAIQLGSLRPSDRPTEEVE